MHNRILSLLLCLGLIFSAAGCGGQSTGSASSQEADAAVEETVDDDTEEATDETLAEEEAPAEEKVLPEEEETPESDETADAEDAAAEGAAEEYAYVDVSYDGEKLVVTPNGTVNDDTVLYNGKTLGALCDYIDGTVLEEGRTINREFLYGLVSVMVVDPEMMTSYEQFSTTMIYCLTFANEFHALDVKVVDMLLDPVEPGKEVFNVIAKGRESAWTFDGSANKFYLDNTEYESSMLDNDTLGVWRFVVDEFFEEGE